MSLNNFSPDAISTHTCTFDVEVRKQNPLLALKALSKSKSVNANSAEMMPRIAAFVLGVELSGIVSKKTSQTLSPCPEKATSLTKEMWKCAAFTAEACALLEPKDVEVLVTELTQLLEGTSSEWLKSKSPLAATSLTHAIALARSTLLFGNLPGNDSKKAANTAASLILTGGLDRVNATYLHCVEANNVLLEMTDDNSEWKKVCSVKFSKSEMFGTVIRPISGVNEPVNGDLDM